MVMRKRAWLLFAVPAGTAPKFRVMLPLVVPVVTVAPGETKDVKSYLFAGAKELKAILLTREDQFAETLAAKLLVYAIGRGLEPFDRPAVRTIALHTRERGGRLDSLIEAVVLSDTFRTCRGREQRHD